MNSVKKVELYAPPDYWRLSPEQKKAFCNGCGPKSLFVDLVPDHPLGEDFSEPCNIHDYMYAMGKTHDDKVVADRVFLNNMTRVIDASANTIDDMVFGRFVADIYYQAVHTFGGLAFWSGKNRPEELCEVDLIGGTLFLEVE